MEKGAQRMNNPKLQWLYDLGFKSGASYPEWLLRDHTNTPLLTVPRSASYIPPLIPTSDMWLEQVRNLVHISALALVADIWTQLLIQKRDHKEKPIYLMWDDEIPKPNPLTSLIWLLTCETWPMPNHNPPVNSKLEAYFPSQTFLLPQSTPYGFAGSRPHGMAEGRDAYEPKHLTGLLATSMHRDDRLRMEKVDEKPVIRRPQATYYTCYQLHEENAANPRSLWMQNEGWPRLSMKALDHNIAAYEWMESEYHHQQLQNLRSTVMGMLLSIPGLPTHRDNLHFSAGMWIRNWSEIGIMTKTPLNVLQWTPANESVSLASGVKLTHIPYHSPRVWFGWTHIGPKYEMEDGLPQKRVQSASEAWAHAYKINREHALRMLFRPESIDINLLMDDAAIIRGKQLERAGRLNKAAAVTSAQGVAMKDAFAQLMNRNKEEK